MLLMVWAAKKDRMDRMHVGEYALYDISIIVNTTAAYCERHIILLNKSESTPRQTADSWRR